MRAMSIRATLEANVDQLRTARALVLELDDAQLVERDARLFPGGSVGTHLRHVLDYYARFLDGLHGTSGLVDYDERRRDPLIERDREVLIATIDRIASALDRVDEEANLRLRVRDNGRTNDEDFTDSTVARELSFLLSHSVHHFALVAMMGRVLGVEPPDGFGVAPSTLRHWQATQGDPACAP